jgi:hypothetical protein
LSGFVHGAGFRLYGRRDIRPDGSYLSTKFFCLAFLPVVPISTQRIIPAKSWVPFGTTRYKLISKQPLHWVQVFSVYLTAILVVIYGTLFFKVVKPFLQARYGVPIDDFPEFLLFCVWMALAGIAFRWFPRSSQRFASDSIRDLDRPTPIE